MHILHVKLSKSLNDGKTRSIHQRQCQVIKDPEKKWDSNPGPSDY